MTSRDEILREIKAAEPVTGCGRWTFLFVLLILIGGTTFVIGISGTRAERTWQAFLVNYLFWSGLAFGSVLFSAILVITKARWGRPVKRLAEAPAAFLPLSFLLFWVLLPGREKIFPWIHEPLPQKAAWLNTGFLFARDGLSIFLLTILSLALVYFSVRGENEIYSRKPGTGKENSDPGGKNLSKQTVLAPLVAIAYALVLSLLGFDLVMSLSPHWYSTLFGMYFFTGAFYSALAALIFFQSFRSRPLIWKILSGKNSFTILESCSSVSAWSPGIFSFPSFWSSGMVICPKRPALSLPGSTAFPGNPWPGPCWSSVLPCPSVSF